jgi:plasmid stabilization system protein ParE
MMRKVKVSKEAEMDLEEAATWYEHEQEGLGTRFIDAFESAIQVLKEPNPPLTPVLGEAAELGAKKLILHRFPFSLVTIEFDQSITVVALAHHSRKPSYWAGRITP